MKATLVSLCQTDAAREAGRHALTPELLAATGAHFLRPVARPLPPAGVGACVAMVAAPIHELWLSAWGALPPGCSVLVRFFASALPAAAEEQIRMEI